MPTTVNLPDHLESRLEALARMTGKSKDYLIREAILEYIEDLEDLYQAEDQSKERIERIRRGQDPTYH